MNRDLRACDVLEDALVSRRFAPLVMLRRGTGDRHYHIELLELFPGARNGAERTRDDLRVNSAAFHLRQQQFELAMPDEWIAAYQGHMQRFPLVDDGKNL